MIIEEGKRYVLRNGAVTGPVTRRSHDAQHPWYANVTGEPSGLVGCIWTESGGGYDSSDTDVVGEIPGLGQAYKEKTDALFDGAKAPVTKASLLDAAKAAVADRGLNYGKPEDNFRRIARLWSTHVKNRYAEHSAEHGDDMSPWGGDFDEIDVALMMDLMKTARLENDPHHQDSWVDKAGYAACGAEIAGGASKDA